MVAAQVRDICMATPLPDAEVRSQDLLVEPTLAASINIFHNVRNHLLYVYTLYIQLYPYLYIMIRISRSVIPVVKNLPNLEVNIRDTKNLGHE